MKIKMYSGKMKYKEFGNLDALLQNAPEKEQNMFKYQKL